MKAYLQVLAISAGSAAVSAVILSLWTGPAAYPVDDTPDPIISGTTAPLSKLGAMTVGVSPPAVFSVSNFSRKTVCLVERGATLTSRSRISSRPQIAKAFGLDLLGQPTGPRTRMAASRCPPCMVRPCSPSFEARAFPMKLPIQSKPIWRC